jgi:hypothetical protein
VPAGTPESVAVAPLEGDQEYVYPPVPPEATTEALPVIPRQGVEMLDELRAITGGSVTTAVALFVQLFLSVMKQV